MSWAFVKYVACGNDFILFDNRSNFFPDSPDLIRKICHRQTGIGADGVLLLEKSNSADFQMHILNSDGSKAEMCGNGLCCFTQWLIDLGLKSPFQIKVSHSNLITSESCGSVCIEMPNVSIFEPDLSITINNQILNVTFINTGVPHAVLFVTDIETINFGDLGHAIRHHPFWNPNGTNVTFAEIIGSHELKVRTYERGVEGETLGCGTGATAAALTYAHHHYLSASIGVQTRSKEKLEIQYCLTGNQFYNIRMIGKAKLVFRGQIDSTSFFPLLVSI